MSINEHVRKLIRLLLAVVLFPASVMSAMIEERFEVLKTGTGEYQNVTVTTRAAAFICIMHSRGISTIKVADLPTDVQMQLGYKVASKSATGSSLPSQVSAQVKQACARLNLPDGEALSKAWDGYRKGGPLSAVPERTLTFAALGIVGLVYLLFCHCCQLICLKTGNKPGILIWLPVLQLFPLLRAASMSPAWFLGFLLPGINLLAQIVWAVKITRARAKSGWTALFLLLPVTNLLAFLYLAFSSSVPKQNEKPVLRRPEIMTLETA